MQTEVKVVEQSATSIVRETMLGAIAVSACCLAVWAILMLKRVQDARVQDKVDDAKREREEAEKDRAREDEQTKAIMQLAATVGENTRTLDRWAHIRGSSSGLYQAVREPMPRDPRDPRRE